MKKTQTLLLLLLATVMVQAQYKKASFFSKGGRTYALGTTAHVMGDGKGTPVGFYFSWGRDKTESHFFRWSELVAIPPYKYKYTTMASSYTNPGNKIPVTFSGKSDFHLVYNFNVGYHLLDRSEEEKKIQPFVFLGFNVVLLSGETYPDISSDYYDWEKDVNSNVFSFGFRGGIGAIYNFTDKIGLKADLGYNHQINFDATDNGTEASSYYIFTKHPLLSVGVRFRFLEE